MKRYYSIVRLCIFSITTMATCVSSLYGEVNPDGSYGHSVSIKIPTGTRGVQPGISLAYNSNETNGIAGIGWNVTGFPCVTRDNSYPINYTNSDSFSGPSGRLVNVNNYYHHSEENFSRFEAKNMNSQGPGSWVEHLPDGSKRLYGSTNDSKVYALNHPGSIRAWALHSVEDPCGNSYEIEYEQDQGQYYPRKIIYTLGNGISRYRVVEFEYEDRPDVEVSYSENTKVATGKRLKWIIVKCNVASILGFNLLGDIARKYRLDYNEDGTVPYSKLISIQEIGADGSELPPVKFEYDITGDPVDFKGNSCVPWAGYDTNVGRWIGGDINGDGRLDLFHVSWFFWINNEVKTHISIGNGSFLSRLTPLPGYNASVGRWISGDYNGDGKTDFLHTVPGFFQAGYANSWFSNGDGTFSIIRSNLGDAKRWLSADINGDGRTDILQMSWGETSSIFHSWISKGNGEFEIKNSSLQPALPGMVSSLLFGAEASLQHAVPIRSGDFNGDGKEDLVVVWFGESPNLPVVTVYALLSRGDGSFTVVQNPISGRVGVDRIASNDAGRAGVQFLVGDINGDGKSDVLLGNDNKNKSVLMLSRGDGTFELKVSSTDGIGWDVGDWDVADINGDGKNDVLHYVASAYRPDRVNVWLSKGDGGFIIQSFTMPGEYPLSDGPIFPGDFTGDGKDDFINVRKSYSNNKINSLSNTIKYSNLITRVRDGSGGSLEIDYSPIRNVPGAIQPEDSEYPYIVNKSHRYIVTRVTAHDGRGSSYSTNYRYIKAKLYQGTRPERKDLLFETVININGAGERAVTHFIQNDHRFHGCPISAEQFDSSGIQTKLVKYDYYENPVTAYGTTLVRLKSVKQINYHRGNVATTGAKEYSYDQYGNTVQVIDSAPGTETITTNTSYSINESGWQLRRISETTVVSDNVQVKHLRFHYTGDLLTSVESYLDTMGTWIVQSFGYDANGNAIQVTDPLGHVSKVEYDNVYRTYPVRSVNAKGQAVSAEYDYRFGSKVAETDVNGTIVHYEYDMFGRLVKTIKPGDEWSSAVVYNITGNAATQYIETRVADDSALGYHYKRQYMDAMGRVYRTVQKADSCNGANLEQVVDEEYNEKGQKQRESLPYVTGAYNEAPLYVTYEYDASNRLIRKTAPDMKTESYEYTASSDSTYTETLTDRDGTRHTLIRDARGRVIKKLEPNNVTLSYRYNKAGLISSIMNTDGLTTTVQYDSLGRKNSIQDPNTGTSTYAYDDAGRLTASQDATGNRVTYEYDELNRIIKIDHPDGTPDVVYSYDDSAVAYGTGRIARINDGVSETAFSYDELGRPIVKTQTVDGRKFIFQMEYDRVGRVSCLTYPDGTAVTREYSETGSLEAVRWGGHSIVKYGRFKVHGQGASGAIDYKLYRVTGDSVETEITYDPATGRPERIISKKEKGAGDVLEDVSYAFDDIGNIRSLTDNLDNSKTQTFEYDELSRLVSAKGAYGDMYYRYLNNGNLIQKGDLGLLYDPKHPYAVSRDSEGNSYRYDRNGNMIERRGHILKYDAVNRLISISRGRTAEVAYTYDHTNHRIKKNLGNGTKVYNIEGLYEVTVFPGRREQHTKYFYGIKNELVAQMTAEDATLAAFYDLKVINRFYAKNSFKGLILYSYEYLNYMSNNRKTVKYFMIASLSFFLCFMIVCCLPAVSRRRRNRRIPAWVLKSAPVLCFCIFAVFGIAGCSNFIDDFNEMGNPPWLIAPGTGNGSEPGTPIQGMFFFHPDYNRNISYVTDAQGVKVYQAYYKPYGEIAEAEGQDMVRYKFNTHELDTESGLCYYNARYYDSNIGRFITADTIVPDPGRSQLLNRYMYVQGNPVTMNDPDGNRPTWQLDLYAEKVMSAWVQNAQNESDNVAVQMCKSLINSFTGAFSWIEGGWKGFLSGWVTNLINYPNFNLSYTYKEGWGVTGGYTNGNQYVSGGGGFHWQEKGPNKGVSVYGTVSFSYYNLSIGLTTSYNINRHTIANNLRVSLSGEGGAIGIGYTWVNDARNGKLIYGGWSGYAGVNLSGLIGKVPTSTLAVAGMGSGESEYKNIIGTREMPIEVWNPGDLPVFGRDIPVNGIGSFLVAESGLMKIFAISGGQPIAILHDSWVVQAGFFPGNFIGFFGSMIPSAPAGLVIGISGLTSTYDYNRWQSGF